MSRNTKYQFVDTVVSAIEARLIAAYERETKRTLNPADPDRLFLAWVANALVLERVNQNHVGNQNIPSSAEGEHLDALGKWIFALDRRAAQPAVCTMRFHLSQAQPTAIPVPKGTRVSDASRRLVWETVEDALVPIGATYVDVTVRCETAGTVGNGYVAGQINTLIDVDNILYYTACENVTVSDGGAEEWNDETYFDMMRRSLGAYSTAGAENSYIYWAKSVSEQIADVKAIRPRVQATETLPVYMDGEGNRFAFIGGDCIHADTITAYAEGDISPAERGTDYTVDYANGLLKIALAPDGRVATEEKIDVTYEKELPGHVHIYALMNDGTPASETIKEAIYQECNDAYRRPLTDYVSVRDLEPVRYAIDCTYYLSEEAEQSPTDIQASVDKAVRTYITWQSEKIGRDINPSKLASLLMTAGIKRVEIRSPVFTHLRSGAENDVPQIASVGEITMTNGGYEDE